MPTPIYFNNYLAVNVRDFGATGSGTTDDSAAIAAAIQYALQALASGPPAGGAAALYFPPGNYLISETGSGAECVWTLNVAGSSANTYSLLLTTGNGRATTAGLSLTATTAQVRTAIQGALTSLGYAVNSVVVTSGGGYPYTITFGSNVGTVNLTADVTQIGAATVTLTMTSTGAALSLQNLSGVRIFGAGRSRFADYDAFGFSPKQPNVSRSFLIWGGSPGGIMFEIDGGQDVTFENMGFIGQLNATTGTPAAAIGVLSNQCSGLIFKSCSFSRIFSTVYPPRQTACVQFGLNVGDGLCDTGKFIDCEFNGFGSGAAPVGATQSNGIVMVNNQSVVHFLGAVNMVNLTNAVWLQAGGNVHWATAAIGGVATVVKLGVSEYFDVALGPNAMYLSLQNIRTEAVNLAQNLTLLDATNVGPTNRIVIEGWDDAIGIGSPTGDPTPAIWLGFNANVVLKDSVLQRYHTGSLVQESASVLSINVVTPGAGYASVPAIYILPPAIIAAAATAKVTGGAVTAINVTSGGTNYLSPPAVTIAGGGGTGAAAVATLVNGSVVGVQVTAGGSGYASAPTVTFTPMLNVIPATAAATISMGAVNGVTPTFGGANFATPPTVSFSGGAGSGAGATAVLSNGVITGVQILKGGSGYTTAPSVAFSSSSGSGAAATAVVFGGAVTAIVVTNGGSGYTYPITVTIGGPGTGALAQASIANGVVTGFTGIIGGSGYTSAPTVTLTGPPPILAATALSTVDGGQISSITLLSGGAGYAAQPILQIVGGGGSGAAGNLIISPDGHIAQVNITNQGSGYMIAPQFLVIGGPGSGAVLSGSLSGGAPSPISTTVTISNAGAGYAPAPTVVFSGGGATTPATGTVTLTPSVQTTSYTVPLPQLQLDNVALDGSYQFQTLSSSTKLDLRSSQIGGLLPDVSTMISKYSYSKLDMLILQTFPKHFWRFGDIGVVSPNMGWNAYNSAQAGLRNDANYLSAATTGTLYTQNVQGVILSDGLGAFNTRGSAGTAVGYLTLGTTNVNGLNVLPATTSTAGPGGTLFGVIKRNATTGTHIIIGNDNGVGSGGFDLRLDGTSNQFIANFDFGTGRVQAISSSATRTVNLLTQNNTPIYFMVTFDPPGTVNPKVNLFRNYALEKPSPKP